MKNSVINIDHYPSSLSEKEGFKLLVEESRSLKVEMDTAIEQGRRKFFDLWRCTSPRGPLKYTHKGDFTYDRFYVALAMCKWYRAQENRLKCSLSSG